LAAIKYKKFALISDMSYGRRKKEVRQRIRSTDVTDVTDVSPMSVGRRKKDEGRIARVSAIKKVLTVLVVAIFKQ